MSMVSAAASRGRILSALILGGIAAAGLVLDTSSAEARSRKHKRPQASIGYTPPFSAMVVDGNTGRVLYADRENEIGRAHV